MDLDLRGKLEGLERCVSEVEQHDQEIRSRVLDLSQRLAELCTRAGIRFVTKDFTIEEFAEGDERVYGYLGASDNGIFLGYRTTQDDYYDDHDPYAEHHYAVVLPASWETRWLRVAATKERLEEL
ncbi:MAG: hypothetical protein EOO70_04550, partial [Myxococcaceae bacterium]